VQRRRRCVDIVIVLRVGSLESVQRRIAVILRQSGVLAHGNAHFPNNRNLTSAAWARRCRLRMTCKLQPYF